MEKSGLPRYHPDICQIDNEISDLLIEKEKLWSEQMNSYDIGTATRKRTTTRNARITNMNERIFELRKIKNKLMVII